MFVIICLKKGREFAHNACFDTLAQALGAGHELTRDGEADFFKVIYI